MLPGRAAKDTPMKVFLVVPRSMNPKQTYREYPLGVGLIATSLLRRGHQVVVYDQSAEGTSDDELLERMRQLGPDVAGFSVITPNYPVARQQIQRIKKELPGLALVAGGIHANLFPQDLLADGIDVVLLGQGQRLLPPLLESWGDRSRRRELPGLMWQDESGIVRTDSDGAGRLADDVDVVDRDVYNLPRYTHHSMLASLGCPFRCVFCCNYSGTVLHESGSSGQGGVSVRRPGRVIDEMRYLLDRYNARKIFFVDDVFLLTRDNILAFCRQLAGEHLPIEWIAQMRVDVMDEQVAAAMVGAGCTRVYFGVESGSDAILRRSGKGMDCQAIRRGIRSAQAAGLRVKTGWIYGLPGSLKEQYETVDLLRELRPHEVSIHQLVPFPGTDYYDHPARHGIRIRDPKDFESFCYGGLGDNVSFDYLPRPELMKLLEKTAAVLEGLGYVSSDRAGAADEYIYSTPLSAVSMSVFRQTQP